MKICYSTNGLKNLSFLDAFSLLKKHEFHLAELCISHAHFPNLDLQSQIAPIQNALSRTGLEIKNIHTGEPDLLSKDAHYPSILSQSFEDRNIRLEFILKVFKFAQSIDVPFVTITSGLLEKGQTKESASKNLTNSLAYLIKNLPNGVSLMLEQEPEMFVSSTDDLLALINEFPNKFYINLDIGHLEVLQEDIPQSIQRLHSKIRNLHFEDIRNHQHKHLIPGEGDIDFYPIFEKLKSLSYDYPLTADLYPFNDHPEEAIELTKKFFNQHLFSN